MPITNYLTLSKLFVFSDTQLSNQKNGYSIKIRLGLSIPCLAIVKWGKSLSRVQIFATPWTVATRLLCPWDFPGKSTGVGCHFLLQGIFPTQGSNPGSCIVGRHFTIWDTDVNWCFSWFKSEPKNGKSWHPKNWVTYSRTGNAMMDEIFW